MINNAIVKKFIEWEIAILKVSFATSICFVVVAIVFAILPDPQIIKVDISFETIAEVFLGGFVGFFLMGTVINLISSLVKIALHMLNKNALD